MSRGGASLGYAAGILGARKVSPHLTTAESIFYQVGGGILFLLPLTLLFDDWQAARWGWAGFASIGYLGVCSTFLAFLIFFNMVRRYGSVQASLVPYFPPVVSLALDRIFLKTLPEPLSIAGGLVILVGVYLTQQLSFSKRSA